MKLVPVEDELYAKLETLVSRSDGIVPVSVESLTNMAIEAFIEGADDAEK